LAALIAALVAMAATAGSEPFVMAWLRSRHIVDTPTERSSHQLATLRGGGIAAVAGLTVGSLVVARGAIALMVVVVTVWLSWLGLFEDTRGARIASRLAAQVAMSCVFVAAMCHELHRGSVETLVAVAVGGVFITAFVNAFNFMDGINGISGLQALVAGVADGLIARHVGVRPLADVCLAVAGAAVGFLPYNLRLARVFLGDVGSYALGAALSAVAVTLVIVGVPVEAVLGPLALYLADTGWTLARRILRGDAWRQPHRSHVYQRLTDCGPRHTQVAVIAAGFCAVLSALGAVSLGSDDAARAMADTAAIVVLIGYLALPAMLRHSSPVSRDARAAENGARMRTGT
jgi:UDP-N-acetylmuramyl pentapeptide phosphotransferase/UDP-N-acetylglucosamine-1-phosphate transferase